MDGLSQYLLEQEAAALNRGCPGAVGILPGLFDALFEGSDCGVVILARDGEADGWRVRDANATFLGWLSRAREGFVGQPLSIFLLPDYAPVAERAFADAFEKRSAQAVALAFYTGNDQRLELHASLQPVAPEDTPGTARMIMLVRRESEELAQAISHAERARERMLAQVSHELRTPLNGILGFAELIEHSLSGSPETRRCREYALDIASAGRELLGRVEDLLVSAEDENDGPANAEPSGDGVALLPLMEAAIEDVRAQAERRRLAFGLLRDPSWPASAYVYGRLQDCRRIFALMLENAVRGAPEGSEVQILCRRAHAGGLEIRCRDLGHPLSLAEIARGHRLAYDGGNGRAAPDPQQRSTAGLLALSTLVRRNGAALDFTTPGGEGFCCSVIFPPERIS